jgi:hypothetical protein
VQAFSVRKNVSTLFSLSRSLDDIESLHGIRAFHTFLLLVYHKGMMLLFNPYMNRTTMAEVNFIFVGELIVTLQMYSSTG